MSPLKQVRVLLVDDDEDDYLITRELLSEIEATHFTIDWARTPNEAYQFIQETLYDVCLLDYRLGRYSGIELLPEFVQNGLKAPVVLLTGQDDPDTDRKAMVAGASDYLVKGRIDASLLERSIRYAIDHKRSEEALRKQGEFVSAVLDTAGALVVVLDREGHIVRFNRACEQVTGYSFAEVKDTLVWEKVLPEHAIAGVRSVFDTLVETHSPSNYENEWLTRHGNLRMISWANTPLLTTDGHIEYIVCVGLDVTEQRQAERDLAAAREREVEVGANIQRTLLVRQPPYTPDGVTIGTRFVPSQKIGGDYFDFFAFDEHRFDILVGDVMGKGVPAALLGAATKTHFQRTMRRLCLQLAEFRRIPEPEEILGAVHSDLTPELFQLESFVTLAYARFDLVAQVVTFIECGHPHPIHLRLSQKDDAYLEGENMPLGMNAHEVYRQVAIPFKPGDLFFFYSDGLTEACDAEGNFFGDERLLALLHSLSHLEPQEIAEAVCQHISEFCGKEAVGDDLTCVALRIGDKPHERPLFRSALELCSDPCELETLRQFLIHFCLRLPQPPSEKFINELVLAVNEAAANTMKHGYKGRTDQYLQIVLEAYADRLSVKMRDRGELFDRSKVPSPSFDGSRDNGFGLYIMGKSLDEVVYSRDILGYNSLSLVKKF